MAYQVFDGKRFLPYRYLKAVAVEVASRESRRSGKHVDIYKETKSGLVLDVKVFSERDESDGL